MPSASYSVLLIGVGHMGSLTARYLVEKRMKIAGAVARKSNLGKDLGEVAGLGAPAGVLISSDLQAALARGGIDVAVITTCSTIEELTPLAEACLSRGVNVLSIAEEGFYPEPGDPRVRRLDALARAHGVSIYATGVQDLFWFDLPLTLTAACQRLDRVVGTAMVDMDTSGPAVLEHYPLGFTEDEYHARQQEHGRDLSLSIFGRSLEAVLDHLGFHAVERRASRRPLFDTVDIRSETLNRTFKAGTNVGTIDSYEVDTAEGTRWTVEFHEKLCRPDEAEFIGWACFGEPDLAVRIDRFPGVVTTCTAIINRIPDLVAAAPGFLTARNLPKPLFLNVSRADGRMSQEVPQ